MEHGSQDSALHNAWVNGKKLAAIAIAAVAFSHSLYATYFQESDEAVAKDNYTLQRDALEDFSDEVAIELAYLKGQVDILKDGCRNTETILIEGPPLASEEPPFEESSESMDWQEPREQHIRVRLPNEPWSKK